MAKADPSINPRILDSARREFLELGFEKASLKSICHRAQVTTGALYKRYRGKEDLFRALVADAAADLYAVMEERSGVDPAGLTDEALIRAWEMGEEVMLWWFRLLYDRYDAFVLILRCAQGTCYSNFQHEWVERMTVATYGYYQEARRRGLVRAELTHQELHVLLTAFWSAIYEPFIHGFSWEEIVAHSAAMCRLFDWHAALNFDRTRL